MTAGVLWLLHELSYIEAATKNQLEGGKVARILCTLIYKPYVVGPQYIASSSGATNHV